MKGDSTVIPTVRVVSITKETITVAPEEIPKMKGPTIGIAKIDLQQQSRNRQIGATHNGGNGPGDADFPDNGARDGRRPGIEQAPARSPPARNRPSRYRH